MHYRISVCTVAGIAALLAAPALLSLASCRDNGLMTYNAAAGDNISRDSLNSLVLIPVRREYLVHQSFNKLTDFKVLAMYAGGTYEIDPSHTSVSVKFGTLVEPLTGTEYEFPIPGEWIITASYGGASGSYAVWVVSENGQGGSPQPGEGDTTINIIIR